MTEDRVPEQAPGRSGMGSFLRGADSRNGLVRTARLVRGLVPGDSTLGDSLSTTAGHPSDRVARLLGEARADQPSVLRELGLAAVQVWQAFSGTRVGLGADTEITVLFTDLVGFSSWALEVGDDQALRLLREVSDVTAVSIDRHHGKVVKGLGDGLMAVFGDATSAVEAAHEAGVAVSAVDIDGYRPQLRAGLHSGRPRRVGRDYFGVDVNVAARVADAASGGEVLITGSTLGGIDGGRFTVRRRRRFRAKGAPKDLEVYAVVPRYGHH
ncbi:adenylate/guanylate cyclase domain-containing protein [Amycolatopsis sp. H20-H5]|uniref:adenylate/guanylate cyclase domain-containing protein n=1 Tax=Amycolatopsis sp. H20-H5 TaxID=3046309 RepID=UPI002DBF4A46|nr:adenylate/guanylate cyclase domain-containing protein [Amycolatopsis sp. H20-H5]MEC3976157.1 adenylate/guanylate cyclase domain-containing protein [Amycolatopsis sp. H20-H5]